MNSGNRQCFTENTRLTHMFDNTDNMKFDVRLPRPSLYVTTHLSMASLPIIIKLPFCIKDLRCAHVGVV